MDPDTPPRPTESDASDPLARAIDTYLRFKSTDGDGGGYYVNSARPVLRQFHDWAAERDYTDLKDLGDEQSGPTVMRQYAKHLSRRVSAGSLSAASAGTYWNVISGFMSDARDDGHLRINPCLRKRAKDPLPEDTADREQQFWDDDARGAILRFVDREAASAIEERGSDAGTPIRNRALVYALAYTGVRGAEILRSSKDAREGRQGLRWKNVDLEAGTIRVLRKTQRWEATPLPRQAVPAVERWQTVLNPPTEEWPVFPTEHAPSLYRTARTVVGDDADLSDVDVSVLLRRHEVPPPSITVSAGRSLMKRLCDDAGIDIDGEYLKLHGARRGIGHKLFQVDRGQAQDLLGHQNPETTKQAYARSVAEERSERVSDLLDEDR